MYTFISFVSAFIVSLCVTPLSRSILKRCGYWNNLDNMHKNQIIRGCGIAIAVTFLLCGYVLSEIFHQNCEPLLKSFLPSAILIIILGLLDDKYNLNAKIKLFSQIIIITILWLQDYRISTFLGNELPNYLSYGMTLLWGLAILNGTNLIDGLDGLCTGNSLISALGMAIMASTIQNNIELMLCIVLIGSCLGFLIYNYHPATLFLGDTGSLFLGLACFFLSLTLTKGDFDIHNSVAFLLVFWIPFCDLGLAVWRRKVKAMLKKSDVKVMERDLFHIHYRILNLTKDHRKTVEIILLIGAFVNTVAIVIFTYRIKHLTLLLGFSLGILTLITLAQYEIRYTICLIKYLTHTKRKKKPISRNQY